MIRLFNVFMSEGARKNARDVLTPDADGRMNLTQGPKVEEFEKALATHFDLNEDRGERPLAMNSCTSALDLALHLAGVGPGDWVISTPMTCSATNGVILNGGARIVWADVDPLSGLINPKSVMSQMNPLIKAIVAVDWSGRRCDFQKLHEAGVPIIEDAAHSLETRGKLLSIDSGTFVCWSFQAIKHLTTGDGGALWCAKEEDHERAKLLRWYGLDRTQGDSFRCSQNISEVGYKYNMNDLAASIGLGNIQHIEGVLNAHKLNASYYEEKFRRLAVGYCGGHRYDPEIGIDARNEYDRFFVPPTPNQFSSWWLYTVLVKNPGVFMQWLKDRGIESSPVHRRNDEHTAFRSWPSYLPGVDVFSRSEVAIPVGWWLTEDEREQVVEAVTAYVAAF